MPTFCNASASCGSHSSCISNVCTCDANWHARTDFYASSAARFGCVVNSEAVNITWGLAIALRALQVVLVVLVACSSAKKPTNAAVNAGSTGSSRTSRSQSTNRCVQIITNIDTWRRIGDTSLVAAMFVAYALRLSGRLLGVDAAATVLLAYGFAVYPMVSAPLALSMVSAVSAPLMMEANANTSKTMATAATTHAVLAVYRRTQLFLFATAAFGFLPPIAIIVMLFLSEDEFYFRDVCLALFWGATGTSLLMLLVVFLLATGKLSGFLDQSLKMTPESRTEDRDALISAKKTLTKARKSFQVIGISLAMCFTLAIWQWLRIWGSTYALAIHNSNGIAGTIVRLMIEFRRLRRARKETAQEPVTTGGRASSHGQQTAGGSSSDENARTGVEPRSPTATAISVATAATRKQSKHMHGHGQSGNSAVDRDVQMHRSTRSSAENTNMSSIELGVGVSSPSAGSNSRTVAGQGKSKSTKTLIDVKARSDNP